MKSIYKPPVEQQIAVPRWSPDGKSVVFIGGLMSDEGSTGGDVFQIAATGGAARDLTPGMASSASNITWPKNSKHLYFTEHFDGGSAISQLDPASGQTERLWQGDESINPPFDDSGISDDRRWQVERGDPPFVAEGAGDLGRARSATGRR